jgi:SAM-dependent methyltransferase
MKPKTSNDIWAMIEVHIDSAALGAALEMGLFWMLADKPQTAADIAQELNIPLGRCRYWLEILLEIGLLDRDGDVYSPSPTAQTAILDAMSKESWALLAKDNRDRFPAVSNLTEDIHEPNSVWTKLGIDRPQYVPQMMESEERARHFTRMLYEHHLPLANELADTLDMKGVKRMMDLGGGSGVVSLALLRKYPDLESVIIEIENVCVAGREIVAEHSEGDRITYHSADFLNQKLPDGFDLVIECDLSIHSEDLFRKLHGCLNNGGRFVLVDQFAPAKGVAPPERLRWAFLGSLGSPDFSYLTADEIKGHLGAAGFAVKSERDLAEGWHLIEACV